MKRTTKILAFALASIFCFAAMSLSIFALDECPDHPDAGWYTEPAQEDNAYFHFYCCNICHLAFGVEDCLFMMDYDCTTRPYCTFCSQLDYSEGAWYPAHEYGNWKPYVAYHYRTCEHSHCLVEETQAHNFIETTIEGTVYEVCIVCSYNRKK